jgi:hypothetical protein
VRPGNNRCTSCKAKRPDVWLRSRWSRADRELVQRLLCGACGRRLGFHFRKPRWAWRLGRV